MSNNRIYKQCSYCHQVKPINEFHNDSVSKDGHCGMCASCKREFTRKSLEKKPYYQIWINMMLRCYTGEHSTNKSLRKLWESYGKRGITVEPFLQDYENFAKFVDTLNTEFVAKYGKRVKGVFDRIDVNGNYERGNLRFISDIESKYNIRSVMDDQIEHMGMRLPIVAWAHWYGINQNLLRSRIRKGWTMERALNEPASKQSYEGTIEDMVVEKIGVGKYLLNGEPTTFREICRMFGVKENSVRGRMQRQKLDIVSALTWKPDQE